MICCTSALCWAWPDGRDPRSVISMPSSGFSPGQGRNTTVVVGIWECFLSSQTRSSEETAGTSRITFWSVRNTVIDYRTDKSFFLHFKRKKKGFTHCFWPCLQNRCKRNPSRWGEGGKRDLFKLCQ